MKNKIEINAAQWKEMHVGRCVKDDRCVVLGR